MTCRHALSLLDDYLDKELDPTLADQVKAHLEECRSCRVEFDESSRLKECLKLQIPPAPAEEYWPEVSALILAKTVDGHGYASRSRSVTEISRDDRRDLVRSVLTLAASICILFGALYLGTQHQNQAKRINAPGSPVLITASLEGLVGSGDRAVMTQKEYTSLLGSQFVLGAPGPLGRSLGVVSLLTF
jgi:predicted anti-sigma-YlaC factor YlaD